MGRICESDSRPFPRLRFSHCGGGRIRTTDSGIHPGSCGMDCSFRGIHPRSCRMNCSSRGIHPRTFAIHPTGSAIHARTSAIHPTARANHTGPLAITPARGEFTPELLPSCPREWSSSLEFCNHAGTRAIHRGRPAITLARVRVALSSGRCSPRAMYARFPRRTARRHRMKAPAIVVLLLFTGANV